MREIVAPDGLLKIGDSTFEGCSSLTSVDLPKSVAKIGRQAFKDCSALTRVVAPNESARIGRDAFKGCDALTICAPKGSAAERYAVEHKLRFEALN